MTSADKETASLSGIVSAKMSLSGQRNGLENGGSLPEGESCLIQAAAEKVESADTNCSTSSQPDGHRSEAAEKVESPDTNCNTSSQPDGHRSEAFQFSEHPSLDQIRQMHASFVRERNWDQFHSPRNVLLAMVGEVGETAELLAPPGPFSGVIGCAIMFCVPYSFSQWKGDVPVGLPDWSGGERKALEDELSDVLIYLVRLANVCHVDLPAAVLRKMAQNERKYPADKVWGSSKKYTEY